MTFSKTTPLATPTNELRPTHSLHVLTVSDERSRETRLLNDNDHFVTIARKYAMNNLSTVLV